MSIQTPQRTSSAATPKLCAIPLLPLWLTRFMPQLVAYYFDTAGGPAINRDLIAAVRANLRGRPSKGFATPANWAAGETPRPFQGVGDNPPTWQQQARQKGPKQ